MRRVTVGRAAGAGGLLAIALFSVYGFIASLEAGPHNHAAATLYVIVGLSTAACAAWILFFKR